MTVSPSGTLILVAGVGGAVGSTTALLGAALRAGDEHEHLLTAPGSPFAAVDDEFPAIANTVVRGWDQRDRPILEAVREIKAISDDAWSALAEAIADLRPLPAPDPRATVGRQAEQIEADILGILGAFPGYAAVVVSLLPATGVAEPEATTLADVEGLRGVEFADFAYALGALRAGAPFVNFTSNPVEVPPLRDLAETTGVPLFGRDGKTGQTYLKVVLASALHARRLEIDGWYSLNLLGNDDGRNLAIPERGRGKVANKRSALDPIVGYEIGRNYGENTHTARVDYYRPRGDHKESWDVVDLLGIFAERMSLRLDFQAKDSVLAAPLVVDLARLAVLNHERGCGGSDPGVAMFFKRPVHESSPATFQEQVAALSALIAGSESYVRLNTY